MEVLRITWLRSRQLVGLSIPATTTRLIQIVCPSKDNAAMLLLSYVSSVYDTPFGKY